MSSITCLSMQHARHERLDGQLDLGPEQVGLGTGKPEGCLTGFEKPFNSAGAVLDEPTSPDILSDKHEGRPVRRAVGVAMIHHTFPLVPTKAVTDAPEIGRRRVRLRCGTIAESIVFP